MIVSSKFAVEMCCSVLWRQIMAGMRPYMINEDKEGVKVKFLKAKRFGGDIFKWNGEVVHVDRAYIIEENVVLEKCQGGG